MPTFSSKLQSAWYSGAWWLPLLSPLEWLFRLFVTLRRWCYRKGLLKTWRAHVPLVVVGNITVGGTGKTPVVVALVESLRQRGIRAGVVSRGYGADRSSSTHVVGEHSAAADCGDEALLIFRRTGCPVVVARDRAEAARILLGQFDVDLIVSDDGLQHYALARDMEILMYDAQLAFGNGRCLPAGPLREPLKRLQSVDMILVRGGADHASAVHYRPEALVNVRSGARESAASSGESVHALAGIAHPGQFFTALRELGFRVTEHAFPDHYRFQASNFPMPGDKPIIMTEKDAVKCRDLVDDRARYLEVSAQLPDTVTETVAALVVG